MKIRGNFFRYVSVLVFILFFLQSVPLYAADIKDYCIVPPYVKREVKPNILILMDNATVMGDAAYKNMTTYAPYAPSADPPAVYGGLFIPSQWYTYGSRTVYTDSGGNGWIPDNGTTSDPNGDGQPGIFSGNLLNWATTSEYDLLESVLVGGKSESRITNVNTLESISNSWTKTLTYQDSLGRTRVCDFIVDGANLNIKDHTGGSCGYLDTPPHPLIESNMPPIASNETNTRFAINESGNGQEKSEAPDNILRSLMRRSFSFLSGIMNFLVPDAEAAKPLAISHASPSDSTECAIPAYSYTLGASGGSGAGYIWSITAGSLPPGLSLSTVGSPGSGLISGTPTTAGTYPFTVQVRDSAGDTDSAGYSIIISAVSFTITSLSPLPNAMESTTYSTTISTNGLCTTGGYTWSVTSGSLPSVLSLNASTGVISGTPAAGTAGTYSFRVQVIGYGAHTATKDFTLTVTTAPVGLTIITTSPLPDATKDSSYTATLSAINGTPPYTWSITPGSLPSGLSLDSSTGVISGTPTTAITYNFTVQVRDSGGATDTKVFSLTVNAVPVRETGNLNVKLCAGTYTCNCNTPGISCGNAACAGACSTTYCPGECVLKTGIVDQMWTQARLGVEDFARSSSEPSSPLSNCIESNPGATPDSDFLTAVENATPTFDITKLVNGEYTTIDYYANNTASNCDPFRSSQNCQKNFVLMITAGVGADNPPTPGGGTPNVFSDATNCGVSAYKNLGKNSCYGYNNDLRASLAGRQYVSTYIVNTMGTITTAGNGTCDPSVTPSTTGDILCQAASIGGGTYYEVVDASALRDTLIRAFQDILKRAAAGTAASVLASGEGSGANLLQAVFYPRRRLNVEIDWTGRLTNFWYYVDPFFNTSSIYEDNGSGSTDYFDFSDDNRVSFYFDIANEKTMAHRYPPTGTLPDIEFEKLNSLWEAGLILWNRDLTSSPRTIKTWVDSNSNGLVDSGEFVDFSTGNVSSIRPYLDLPTTPNPVFADGDLNHDGLVDDDDAELLIRYIHGEDFSYLRPRSVIIGGVGPKVWKLGDILNSTPKISSWIPLNNYNTVYKDTSYDNYTKSSTYTGRGMVFAGGNDGMLHAFRLGKLELTWTSPTKTSTQVARMTGSDLGKEIWAYIPKNALPYLKYIKETDYCHVYSIDLSPYVFDASIGAPGSGDISNDAKPNDGSTWRTILIGGMRYGGACRDETGACNSTTNGLPDCVKTPVTGKGYSSYFALDITDQNNPTLLWEFSNESLGFTTTGPAVVRIGDSGKNGKWFVVLGSGPTGPIDTTYQQFLGRSDQNLSLFVLDVKTGALLRTINTFNGSSISNAFAGSMLNSTLDADVNYQDDVVYIGYVKKHTSLLGSDTWTDGGVIRLQTKETTNVSNWEASQVIDGIGPVTSAVTKLVNKNKGNLWLFFGTGRYYFEKLDEVDDADTQRTLFGLKEPCYSSTGLNRTCTTTFSGTLTDVSSIENPTSIADGWKINLDATGNYTYLEGTTSVTRTYRAERVITDPLATSSGLVFFTTYKPYTDVCAYGGKSFIWAVKYSTGGAPGALLKGIALLQVSTGSIEQVNLSTAFTERNLKRTSALEGVPPTAQGLSLMSTPPPVKRTIHIRER